MDRPERSAGTFFLSVCLSLLRNGPLTADGQEVTGVMTPFPDLHHKQKCLAFTPAGDEVFVVSSETGVDGIEALGHPLVLPHQYPVLQVPQVDALE